MQKASIGHCRWPHWVRLNKYSVAPLNVTRYIGGQSYSVVIGVRRSSDICCKSLVGRYAHEGGAREGGVIKRPIQVSDESQEGTNKCAMHRLCEDATSVPMVRVRGCLPEWPQTT